MLSKLPRLPVRVSAAILAVCLVWLEVYTWLIWKHAHYSCHIKAFGSHLLLAGVSELVLTYETICVLVLIRGKNLGIPRARRWLLAVPICLGMASFAVGVVLLFLK